MRPLDFYHLGLRLADSADTESEWRTVVGRLYYGLHHEACCRYFRENPNDPPLPRNGRHSALIERFGGEPGTVDNDVARTLRLMLRMRNVCDYELGNAIRLDQRTLTAEQLARLALIVAGGLLTALESFSPGEAPGGCDCPTLR